MSQIEKLIERIGTVPNDLRFEEVRKVLEYYGYIMYAPHSGSSHCTFRKPGKPPITIPRHSPVKRIYVLMVKEVIENERS